MDRRKASEFPQELLNLFDQYVHGGVSRREFMDGAQKFAVGGVTAAALFEMLKPNYAWAVEVQPDDKRIKTERATVPSPQGVVLALAEPPIALCSRIIGITLTPYPFPRRSMLEVKLQDRRAVLERRAHAVRVAPEHEPGQLPIAGLGVHDPHLHERRALAQEPSVMVVVNPTVGVDVASKEALLDAIGDARDRGVAILLVSDDFEDLRVCTRLLIMVRGVVAREFTDPPWERQSLISAVEGLVEQDG